MKLFLTMLAAAAASYTFQQSGYCDTGLASTEFGTSQYGGSNTMTRAECEGSCNAKDDCTSISYDAGRSMCMSCTGLGLQPGSAGGTWSVYERGAAPSTPAPTAPATATPTAPTAPASSCAFTTCTYQSLGDGLFHTKIATTMDSENFSCGKVEGTTDTCACECADHHKCTLDHAMGDGMRVQRDHCEATAPAPTPPPTPPPTPEMPAEPVVATLLHLKANSVELSAEFGYTGDPQPWAKLTSTTKDSEVPGLGLWGVTMVGNDLTYLHLDNWPVKMTGQLPSFAAHKKLEGVFLSSNPTSKNAVTGTIPSFNENTELRRLELRENDLTGTIPSFSNCQKMWDFSVRDNRLSGSLPSFDGLEKLSKWSVSGNELTGSLPAFNGTPFIQKVWAARNKLTGRLPDPPPQHLVQYRVEENMFTGPVPDFSTLLNPLTLRQLYLNDNLLSGPVPTFAANSYATVTMENNNFDTVECPKTWDGGCTGFSANWLQSDVPAATIKECHDACKVLPGCGGMFFNPTKVGVCSLYRDGCTPNDGSAIDRQWNYYAMNTCTAPPSEPAF